MKGHHMRREEDMKKKMKMKTTPKPITMKAWSARSFQELTLKMDIDIYKFWSC